MCKQHVLGEENRKKNSNKQTKKHKNKIKQWKTHKTEMGRVGEITLEKEEVYF